MLKKIKYRIQVMKKLQPMTAGVRKWYAINLAAALAGLALLLILPQFYSLFIEKVILGRKIQLIGRASCRERV